MKILIGIAAEDELLRNYAVSVLKSLAGQNETVRFNSPEEVLELFKNDSEYFGLYNFGICERITDKYELMELYGLWVPFHFVCVARMDTDIQRRGADPEFRQKELWRLASGNILFTSRPEFLRELEQEWKTIVRKGRHARACN